MDRRKFLQIAGSICVAVPCLNNKSTSRVDNPTDDLEIQTLNICTTVDMPPMNFEIGTLEPYPETKINHTVKITYKYKTETWLGKDRVSTDINKVGLTKDSFVKIINKRIYVRYNDLTYCEITLDKRISAQEYEELTKV